jgi:hypothetical protein
VKEESVRSPRNCSRTSAREKGNVVVIGIPL